MAKPRPIPAQDRSRRTEQALLDAALRSVRERGIDAVTVIDIATEAGVSPASIHRRFGDKDGLIRAAFQSFVESSLAMLADVALLPRSHGMVDTIADVTAAVLAFSRANQGILQSAYARALVDHEFAVGLRELRTRTYALLRGRFLARADEIRHPDPKLAIEFVLNQAVAMLSARLEAARLDVAMIEQKVFVRELMRSLLAYLEVPFTPRAIDTALAKRGL